MEQTQQPAAIQCDLGAIAPAERQAHQALTTQLFEVEAREMHELDNGYAVRLDGARFDDVIKFVANERLCCPFWSFSIELAPAGGAIWLRLSGPEGAKEVLK